MVSYDRKFFEGQESGSRRSAERIVPIVNELIRPNSVIDVGCGVGHWAAVFKQHGVAVAHGIDGPWVEAEQLQIPKSDFFVLDFAAEKPPYSVESGQPRYDLAISLEFLEHIDEKAAPDVVRFLCSLSDVVAVGAAVPGQGGTYHVNEQWPEYWARLFEANGYVACDVLRPIVWSLPDVEFWYAQNPILYFRSRVPDSILEVARQSFLRNVTAPPRLVHPGLLAKKNDLRYNSIGQLVAAVLGKLKRGFAKIVSGRW